VARPGISLDDPETMSMTLTYGPLTEVMYLMMRADGEVDQAERDVIRGALRELDDRIHTPHVDRMIEDAAAAFERDGGPTRIRTVATAMVEDPVQGEVAFVLASAVAFADSRIAPEENTLLNDLAEALDIDDARSEELMRLLLK
jgi:uncharacterized membrane protein YebE (DUF533 family)